MDRLLDPSLANAGLAFLLGLAGKGSLVLALASLVARACARRSAALRHGVWTLAVAALLALPLVAFVLPPLPAPWPRTLALDAFDAAAPAPARRAGVAPAVDAKIPAAPVETPAKVAAPVPAERVVPSPALLGLVAWLVGAMLVIAYFARGKFALARLARGARVLDDEAWRGEAAEVAASLGLARVPRLLVGDAGISPLTWGLLRPTVLLPAHVADGPAERRRSFLVHELAHVARRDSLVQDAAHFACALWWFHPGAWYAAHRLRVEREPACDDLVLADGVAPASYAGHLLAVVREARVPRGALSLSGASMAAPSRLEARVRALLDGARDRRGVGRRGAMLAGCAAFALVVPLAALVPAAPSRAAIVTLPSVATTVEVGARTVEGTGSLDARWRLALVEGPVGKGRGRGFWFAYAIAYDDGQAGSEVLISDSEGWSLDDLTRKGTSLSERLGCRPGDAVVLMRVRSGAERKPAFDRVALRNAGSAPDLGGLPVVAVGVVPFDESLDWLTARLDETPDDERAAVLVTAMSLHATGRTAPLLTTILDGRRGEVVRTQAAEGLARHPSPQAVAKLDAHARDDRAHEVRRESAEALGDIAVPSATETLIDLVRDLVGADEDDQAVRMEAIESLGEREPAKVVPVLVAVANDPKADESSRREAVETLGDLPGNAGLEALRRMAMGHGDSAVRDEAVETLHEMGERAERAAKGHGGRTVPP